MLALFLCCLIYGVLGEPGHQSNVDVHGCAKISFQGHHVQYQVTDGEELVTSIWDKERQLVSCSLDGDPETLRDFISQCQRRRQDGLEDFGFQGFAEIRLACLIFLNAENISKKRGPSAGKHGRVRRGFTYPGTLWCGVGNNAEEESDLGEHKETDACCRSHDHCEHVIHPFTSSYGYRNLLWHTISHCQCDNQFKDCLRRVNNTSSQVVGQAFFNVIQAQCFEFSHAEQCVERHWYGWCKKYKNVTVAVVRDSGLYDYGGDLIDAPVQTQDKEPSLAPSLELTPGQPTLGQVMQATEDLLKIMVTISPTTSPDQITTASPAKKKKDKTKQKERKNKKGKGLKGKRKNRLNKEKIKSPAKDIWGEEIAKNERGLVVNTPMDSILDIGQDPFNDILNDDPMRNVDSRATTIAPTIKHEAFKAMATSPPQEPRPNTDKPKRKNRKERKGKKERRKKAKKASGAPDGTE